MSADTDSLTLSRASGVQTSPSRLMGIEWLRFVSCLGIVWFHMHAYGASVGYGGLPALMAISVALAARPRHESAATVFAKRAKILLVPWLFWSVVYAIPLVRIELIRHGSMNSYFPV